MLLPSTVFFPYSPHRHAEAVPNAPALSFQQVYVDHPRDGHPALEDISFSIEIGQRVALVGTNGAGKSTLLKTIAGLLPAQRGEIEIFGHGVKVCHHRVAYLPQRGEIDWRFPISVRKLILAGRYVHLGWLKSPSASDRQTVQNAIDLLGLQSLAERQIGQLSGGQQQRALLARVIAQEADLLLLDEPFNAVDSDTRATIMKSLEHLKAQQKTVLVATHDVDRLAHEFDRTITLDCGRIVQKTKPIP